MPADELFPFLRFIAPDVPVPHKPEFTSHMVRIHFYEAVHNPVTGDVRIKVQCPMCETISEPITVKESDLMNWHLRGQYAQNAFPYLNEDIRELLITGLDDCYPEFPEE